MYFSENLKRVFSKEGNDFEGFKLLFSDYVNNREIYDEDGAIVSRGKAKEKINRVVFDILGLDSEKRNTKRDMRRAWRKHGVEFLEVIEEEIDWRIETGWRENEFFNSFVEMRNLAQGDRNEFYTPHKEVILTVAKVSGDHHDLTMQKLAEGTSFSVSTSNYAVKVGMDIDVYLTGRKDWTELVDAVSRAYTVQIQNDMFTAMIDGASSLPSNEQFVISKELVAANKADFDELIEDVEMVNDAPVVIMGAKVALKKLQNLTDVTWASNERKREIETLGRLGSYESTELVEIPQRFKINDITQKLVPTNVLFIIPNTDNRFVKFVDVGETEIVEVTEKADRNDDFMTYEAQREMGVAVIHDHYYGKWTIA